MTKLKNIMLSQNPLINEVNINKAIREIQKDSASIILDNLCGCVDNGDEFHIAYDVDPSSSEVDATYNVICFLGSEDNVKTEKMINDHIKDIISQSRRVSEVFSLPHNQWLILSDSRDADSNVNFVRVIDRPANREGVILEGIFSQIEAINGIVESYKLTCDRTRIIIKGM